jgi:thiamine-phosphate pyrophosphorylase
VLDVFAAACRRHGALLAVNDRADVAVAAGADVLHVGQRDLPPSLARRILGSEVAIGLSSHSQEQATAAATAAEVDYFCIGPIWPTPTKAGRPHTGLEPIRAAAAANLARPWFAIGGIDESTLDQVLDAGAERVVVVRAITSSPDPGEAAKRIRNRIEERLAGRTGDQAAGLGVQGVADRAGRDQAAGLGVQGVAHRAGDG